MSKTLFYTQKNPYASDFLHFSSSKGSVELKVRQPISISNELYEALMYENKGFKATVDDTSIIVSDTLPEKPPAVPKVNNSVTAVGAPGLIDDEDEDEEDD